MDNSCSHVYRETGNTRTNNGEEEIEFKCIKCNDIKWEKASSF